MSRSSTFPKFRPGGDAIAHAVTLAFALALPVITSILVIELYRSSAVSRAKFGWAFLSGMKWDPVTGSFGALPFVYGTVLTAFLALLISAPLGLGAAIFLAEMAPPRLSDWLAFVTELLAAVPSVIYGLLGIFLLTPVLRDPVQPFLQRTLGFLPFFRGPCYGVGFLAAGLVLALMVIPFIISLSRESLLAVPREQREAALALGATRWEATRQIVVPCARAGITGSIFLALARALGETMAVTMVIGNTPQISASLYAPGYSIAAVIANEFMEAVGEAHPSALMELGLLLFFVTVLVNALARVLIRTTMPGGRRP